MCRLNERNSPTSEIIRHSLVLERWLEKSGYGGIRIKKAILMVGDRFLINKRENPVVYVITGLDNLDEYIQGSYEDPRFTSLEFRQELTQFFGNKYLK